MFFLDQVLVDHLQTLMMILIQRDICQTLSCNPLYILKFYDHVCSLTGLHNTNIAEMFLS